jgi:GNAT superfamily N-acetyltransferase
MKALRPHLKDSSEFVARWRKQQSQSYELLVAWDGDTPLALAGFRHQENLLHGPHLYVDDLVTVEHARGRNLGTKLMKRLKLEAAS